MENTGLKWYLIIISIIIYLDVYIILMWVKQFVRSVLNNQLIISYSSILNFITNSNPIINENILFKKNS